jgi:hypothetical protein
MAAVILRYDLRVPPEMGTSAAAQYAACLEQCRWGDRIGLDVVTISEHHGVDDGFLPAPVSMATAIAAATERIAINIAALLVIFHDPVRLAEELAVADIVAKGRVSVVAGTGYRQEEFEMHGIEFKNRYELLEDTISVLRQAWTGEYFTWKGRRIRVRPAPHTPGGPMLLMGGSTENAARRAARLRCMLSAATGDSTLAEVYYDECKKIGFQGFAMIPVAASSGFIHISDDPERDWERIAPHALHEALAYDGWQRKGQHSLVHVPHAKTLDDLRASGVYNVLTPAEAIEVANTTGSIVLHPLMGGIPPDLAWESLDLFERKVLPAIK